MSYLNALLTDLRDKKLWPLALALLLGVIAVPVLLSKSPAAAPAHPLPSAALPVASDTGAAVTVNVAPTEAPLTTKARDPFSPQTKVRGGSTTPWFLKLPGGSSASASKSTGSNSGGTGVPSSTGNTGGTGSTGSSGGGTTPPVLPPITSHRSAPSGLTSLEAYHVSLAMTNGSGGVNAIDPLTRDSELPTSSKPLVVELGVLQGSNRVLFFVNTGAVVSGPGTCIPGPVDCEILSLAVGQTESVHAVGSYATTLFQVTDISVDKFATAGQAAHARAQTVRAGAKVLSGSGSATLGLFQYDSALGAVVDQRNLTVGGN